MIYWMTAISMCAAMLVQYLCSARIMRMKQAISVNKLARRDIRFESERLSEQERSLSNQQGSLTHAIARLQSDTKELMPRLREKGLEVPDPDFPLSELEATGIPEHDTDLKPEDSSDGIGLGK